MYVKLHLPGQRMIYISLKHAHTRTHTYFYFLRSFGKIYIEMYLDNLSESYCIYIIQVFAFLSKKKWFLARNKNAAISKLLYTYLSSH